jgi:hypothetical protein
MTAYRPGELEGEQQDLPITVSVDDPNFHALTWKSEQYVVDENRNLTLPRGAIRYFESLGMVFADPN